ncbi:MAG: chromate transporter [Bacteroidales bacterium]|nr:chromate transporter [Bacteroidales bacterium]
MIFWQLLYTFCKIGLFNFGGGYAMIALIHSEVVERWGWLSSQEFTDIVAVSQATPGPIGINVATYAGYTAVVNAGYAPWAGALGAALASGAVVLLPVVLMLLVSRLLQRHRGNRYVASMLGTLRLAVVGIIAAAALLLVSPANFGSLSGDVRQLAVSIVIFVGVFVAARLKVSPIALLLISGAVGLLVYL